MFGELTEDGLSLLVSSHVMDEAERCDELLLMRDRRVLTQDSPGALTKRTATHSMDAAFLRLVSQEALA